MTRPAACATLVVCACAQMRRSCALGAPRRSVGSGPDSPAGYTRERRANDAERELVQWKKVRFMADKVGDEFTGFVTGVSAFGLHIEL
ncbi:MAG: hypothetical protein ACO3RU_09900, partial [Planctomycetota bacterium]